jgi:hypothetical protein
MSDGNLSYEIWKEEKRRKWKLDIKFGKLLPQVFRIIRAAIKAKSYIKPRS